MTASAAPPVGSLVGYPAPTGTPRFALYLSVDRDTGHWWVACLQHPFRRARLDPDEVTVVADRDRFRQVLHGLALETAP